MTQKTDRAKVVALHSAGDHDAALNAYATYLSRHPNDHMMWSNLGALFRTNKQFDMSVATHRRALAGLRNAQTLGNASNAFFDAGIPAEATKLRKEMLKTDPDNPMSQAMLAKFMRGDRKYKDAERVLKRAIKDHPDHAELHIQMAMAKLSLGHYPEGFAEFNWRWLGDEISPPDFDFPKWTGEDLNGKTILVTPEQGFGDTVLMARFFDGLKALGCTVKFSCKAPLQRLLKNINSIDMIATSKSHLTDVDFWVPMMDLPLRLGTTLDTIPATPPLHLPIDSIARAHQIVAPYADKFKLGVLWSGSVTYRANHKRSFSHHNFMELADIAGLQMFSLYKGPLHDAFIKDGAHTIIYDAAGSDRDFADSAALINELDLVITMDSAIAHVAGSLGVPVWNLLHSEPYWLYEPFEKHTPWYPSMKLVRQKHAGDWDSVFEQLRKDVKQTIKKRILS